jgi:hypothetical protein
MRILDLEERFIVTKKASPQQMRFSAGHSRPKLRVRGVSLIFHKQPLHLFGRNGRERSGKSFAFIDTLYCGESCGGATGLLGAAGVFFS